MKPSLCVINYNGKRYLRDTLAAARQHAAEFSEILVFDNASDDGSPELAEWEFPDVKVVRLGENRGPAPARNAALVQAVSNRILIVDNDVRVGARCAEIMAAALEDRPNAAIAMPSVIYAHQPDIVQYDGAEAHFLGQQALHHENHALARLPRETRTIGSLVTACFMVDRARLPGDMRFDESFFIYVEDHDFGVRTRLLGREILSVPSAHCYHAEGTEGLSLRQLGQYSSMRVFCVIRNRWIFLCKNYTARTLLLLAPLLAFYELAQLFVALKKGWFKEWWQAVRWITANFSEIRAKRKVVQRLRVVSDREIVTGGRIPFREELVRSPLEALARRILDGVAASYWVLVRRVL